MKPKSKQKIARTKVLKPSSFMKHLVHQCFYLLQKSLGRYEYLKKSRAPYILVKAEKVLIRRQLSFLFNLRAEMIK